MSESMTQADFARHINVQRSYVTQLKNEGRLVFGENRRVMVDESQALIDKTRDASKEGVAERHAEQRENKSDDTINDDSDGGESFNHWKTKNEKKKFFDADRESKVREGELLEKQEAKRAIMDSDSIVRNRLEAMPDMLSHQLAAESDEHKIRIILIEHVEYLLNDLSKTFREISA